MSSSALNDGPGAGSDRVSAAAADLYGADPQEFTERRKTLAAAAKTAGDNVAAKRISALRKPTRAAWVVNQLARADPGAPARLAALADALRAAEQARDGPRLRELSATRGPLIDELTGQALDAAGMPDPSAALREEVGATLTSALADPDVAAEFAAGTLTRAAQWAGFGAASFGVASDAAFPEIPASSEIPAVPETPLAADRSSSSEAAQGASARARGAPGRPAPPSSVAEEAARQAARRREIFEDAERSVASATAAAAAAVAAEDRLEGEVRDLEERLTKARTELADIRLRARRAEAAERKARQVLERLPRP